MFFEVLAGLVLEKGGERAAEPLMESFSAVLDNRQALAFAKARLRLKYEELVRPASYESVTENLRVTKEDFLEYFRQEGIPTAAGLERHLLDRLRERAADWAYNKPGAAVFDALVADFYKTYHSYFLTTDPALSALHLIGLSNEALDLLAEIRSRLDPGAKGPAGARSRLPVDLTTLLQVLNIPFEIVEAGPQHIDLVVIEPSALLPTRFFLSATEELPDSGALEGLRRRAERRGPFSHILLVTSQPPTADNARAAEARGIQLQSSEQFRSRFLALGPLPPVVVGALASHSLLEKHSVHEVFISPDAVVANPGDRMEDKFLSERQPASALVEQFLAEAGDRILFILGGYGSGKSAFAAHLTSLYSTSHPQWTAACIPLSRLKSGDDLLATVVKAEQLIRATRAAPGGAVVILDGLDELPNAMSINEKRFNMLRLLEVAPRVDKLIVMVRTSYFRGLDDFWRLYDTGEQDGLWRDLRRFVSAGQQSPTTRALVLREFDSQQIAWYVERIGQVRGYGEGFAAGFFAEMKANDPQEVYRSMARSPLYLFLLVNTQPWKNPAVKSFADVLETFIRYWLARDIEKGPSRWLLTTSDRLEFADAIAWWIFSHDKRLLTFAEFEQFVQTFYGSDRSDEIASISLDLQTTGIFACVGGVLYFAVPVFMDYFVAMRFARGFRDQWPARLPTPSQARLWLGIAESRETGEWMTEPGGGGEPRKKVAAWFDNVGIDPGAHPPLELDPHGILYGGFPEGWCWPFVNSDGCKHLRAAIRQALDATSRASAPDSRSVFLRLTNRLGLHARASARLVTAIGTWRQNLPPERQPTLALVGDGEAVEPQSILGLMMLAAPQGTVLELRYAGCELADIEELLAGIRAVPEAEGVDRWRTDLFETD